MAPLLANTRGNLYALNKLNRLGELATHDQIRIVSNRLTLWDFVNGWSDEHDLGQPLTAALFDTMVDIFHELMKDRGLISEEIEDLSDQLEGSPAYEAVMQDIFDEVFENHPDEMREALADARDFIGVYLATAFSKLTPQLTYYDVADALQEAEQEVSGGRYQEVVAFNLWQRGIGQIPVGPRLTPPDEASHAFSVRTDVPGKPMHRCRRRKRRKRANWNG